MKPLRAVESLINQTAKPNLSYYESSMSKTAGVSGFGLKKTPPHPLEDKNGPGKSSHLLEKIRRNQQNLAQSSN